MQYYNLESSDGDSLDKIYKINDEKSKSNSNSSNNKFFVKQAKRPRLSLTSDSSNSNKERNQETNKKKDLLDLKNSDVQRNVSPSDHTYSKKVLPPDNSKGGSSLVIMKKNTPENTNKTSTNNKIPGKIVYDPNMKLNEKPNAKKKAQMSKGDQPLKNSNQETKQLLKTNVGETKQPLNTNCEETIQKQDQMVTFKIPKVNEKFSTKEDNEKEPSPKSSKQSPKDLVNKKSSPLNPLNPTSKLDKISSEESSNNKSIPLNPINDSSKVEKKILNDSSNNKTSSLHSSKTKSNVKKPLISNHQHQIVKSLINSDKTKSKQNESSSILEKLNNPLITKNVSEKLKQSAVAKLAKNTSGVLTLASFETHRKSFNSELKNTIINPIFLLKNYTDNIINTQNSKFFVLLNNNLPPKDNVLNIHSELNRDDRIDLSRLMTQNAGNINYFDLYGFDESISSPKSWWLQSRANEKVLSEEFRKRAFDEILNECPFFMGYEFFCSLQKRNSAPYKHVEKYWIGNIENNVFFFYKSKIFR